MKLKTISTRPNKNIDWKKIIIILSIIIAISVIIVGSILLIHGTKAKYNFLTIEFKDKYVEYDGSPKTIEATGLPSDATIAYTPTNTYIEPGIYPVTATIKQQGYNDYVISATLHIEKYYNVNFHQFSEGTIEEVIDVIKVKEGESLAVEEFPSVIPFSGFTITWEQIEDIDNVNEDIDVYTFSKINRYQYTLKHSDGTITTEKFTYYDLPITLVPEAPNLGLFFGWYTQDDFDPETQVSIIETVGNYNLYSYVLSETEGLSYQYAIDHVEVLGYTGSNNIVVIPAMKNNLPVTIIKENAFLDNQIMTELYILSDKITLLERAFRNTNLNKIHVYGEIVNMQDRVFSNNFVTNQLVISEGTKYLGTYCFSFNTSLRSFVLPKSILSIDSYCFNACSGLSSIYYAGSKTEFAKISIAEEGNECFTHSNIYFYSEEKPINKTEGELYWHYVNGMITIWED